MCTHVSTRYQAKRKQNQNKQLRAVKLCSDFQSHRRMANPILHSEKGYDWKSQRERQEGNVQMFQQRKQAVCGWPVEKKLEKLAIYSSCEEDASSCKCNGWKDPNPPERNPTGPNVPKAVRPGPCKGCGHALSSHGSHLEVCLSKLKESARYLIIRMWKRLSWTNCLVLQLMLRIFLCAPTKKKIVTQSRYVTLYAVSLVWLIKNQFIQKVFVFLFKLLRYALEMSSPSIQDLLEIPPHEKPNIVKGVNNFVFFRFKHLPPKERQMM